MKKQKLKNKQEPVIDPQKNNDDWDEARIDVVGQNGNDGIHYDVYDEVDALYKEK